jgi:hypothetical protein
MQVPIYSADEEQKLMATLWSAQVKNGQVDRGTGRAGSEAGHALLGRGGAAVVGRKPRQLRGRAQLRGRHAGLRRGQRY